VALPELGGAAGIAEPDAGQELQQELDVQVGDVVPEQAGGADPLEQLDGQRLHLLGQGELLGGRDEGPGEPDGQPVGVRGHDAAQEAGEGLPGLVTGGQCPLDLGEVDLLPVPAQGAQQVLLARVPVVEGADAHPGPLGHRGDRGGGIGQEHLPGRLQDELVVLRRLCLPAAQRGRATRHNRLRST